MSDELLALRATFLSPDADTRPTPLYWWSGADLDRERISAQLDELASQGIGGTVVGYSHLPDTSLDHGSPTPLSSEWWELFRWFVGESRNRGMTVGVQDYGIIGPVLIEAGRRMPSLGGGMLHNTSEQVSGPAVIERPGDIGRVLSRRAVEIGGTRAIAPVIEEDGGIHWDLPSGEWMLSTVQLHAGEIGGAASDFDPLHPESGGRAIEIYYDRFEVELGDQLGSVFTTFFQDELDFGVVMPMWNDVLAASLAEAGYPPEHWLHALWHDLGDQTLSFRARYRDTVIGLLETNYFRPIFEWHEQHGTSMVMDQLSRGDLRLGRAHYGDFLQTMQWYQGPGNDDPDLTGPRNVSAFKVSASIAHLHGRPLVTSEAFHSSGWGITAHDVISGLNIGFACGVNQVILHGLNYTTDGGWWEWASPDFHFRQPWWQHSAPLWTYVARMSTLLRAGEAVTDVAVVDPTQEIDLGVESDSPERARATLEVLMRAGINADLVPQAMLADAQVISGDVLSGDDGAGIIVGHARYRAVVLPAMTIIREAIRTALDDFVRAGGVVVALGSLPTRTEWGRVDAATTSSWHRAELDDLAETLRTRIPLAVEVSAPEVLFAHRRVGDVDVHVFVNAAADAVRTELAFRDAGRLERWDPWTGDVTSAPLHPKSLEGSRSIAELNLAPGESAVLVLHRGESPDLLNPAPVEPVLREPGLLVLDDGWEARPESTLDNRFGDFLFGGEPLGVSTFHVETALDWSGPWEPGLAGHGTRFWGLGPIVGEEIARLDTLLSQLSREGLRPVLQEGTVDLDVVSWRPYRMSFDEGVSDDAYLRDRMTGPHGLKGVPDEFLDPRNLDAEAPAGAAYYFVSSVVGEGEPDTLTAAARCSHRVWVNGESVLERDGRDVPEIPAAFFPPWGLRDMSTEAEHAAVYLGESRSVVLVKLVVSADQPSRAAVVVGGSRPEHPERAQSSWWQGSRPAREFVVGLPGELAVDESSDAGVVWVRARIPIGARTATVSSEAGLVEAVWNDHPIDLTEPTSGSVTLSRPTEAEEPGGFLLLALRVGNRWACDHDAGQLRGPIHWQTDREAVRLSDWVDLGLADFSGTVTYERTLDLDERAPFSDVALRLEGLVGSAQVFVNDTPVGIILTPEQTAPLTDALVPGRNVLRIEVANALENLFSRLPSPFTIMQAPGGGFSSAVLEIHGRDDNALSI